MVYVSVFVLVFRHANRIFSAHYIVICNLSRRAMFFHGIAQTAGFSKRKLLNMKCVFRFSAQLLSETFIILRKVQRHIINSHRSSRKLPNIFVRFQSNLNFIYRLSKNPQKYQIP
jgi:hypothetical protein